MDKAPVKVGVVGAGIFGVMHMRAFTQLAREGHAQLVGFVNRNPERRAAREQEFGVPGFGSLEELIEKTSPHAVSIVTPDHLHRPFTLQAAEAGIHVLSEKPMDTTAEGCQEMIDACQRAGVLLQVDFHKRYDPDHRAAHEAVRAGKVGEILYGSAHMEDRIEVPTEWLPEWAADSSPAWFLGVHFFDLVRWIIGSEPVSVVAFGQKKLLSQQYGIDTFDSVNARVQFQCGASVAFDVSWIIPKGFEAIVNQGCRIVGTKGLFEIDTQDRGITSCLEGEGMRTLNNNFFREGTDKAGNPWFGGYGIESITDFIFNVQHVIEHGINSRPAGVWADGFDGLQATKMALAAHKSIDQGGAVIPV